MRILAQNLTEEQQSYLASYKGQHYTLCSHAAGRMVQYGITLPQLSHAIQRGTLVEFHNDVGTRRMLLRDDSGTCVVLDLDCQRLITVYHNSPDDNHATLQHSLYQDSISDSIIRGVQ